MKLFKKDGMLTAAGEGIAREQVDPDGSATLVDFGGLEKFSCVGCVWMRLTDFGGIEWAGGESSVVTASSLSSMNWTLVAEAQVVYQ